MSPNTATAFRGNTGKYLEQVLYPLQTTIERGLYRALQELKGLQVDREGRDGTLPKP